MKILFIDLNESLVRKVSALGIDALYGDYFHESNKVSHPVLMTASNPFWSFGGGIDAHFMSHYKGLCSEKQSRQGGNERIGNICFTVTVNDDIEATEELVRSALKFAVDNTDDSETLCLNGSGTGIGGLSEERFCEILAEVLNP